MASQNGIIGDSVGVELPQAQPDPDLLKEERAMASFSRTAEFKRLKTHLEGRIEFYKTSLPNGQTVSSVPIEELGRQWLAASAIIGELTTIINAYELASEAAGGKQPL
jgi:hypothetical protein